MRRHHHLAHGVHRPWLVRFLEHPHGPHLGGLAHVLVWLATRAGVLAVIAAGLILLTQLARVWLRVRMLRSGAWFELRLPEEFDRGRFAQAAKSLAPLLGEALPGVRLDLLEQPLSLHADDPSRLLVRAFGSSARDQAPLETSCDVATLGGRAGACRCWYAPAPRGSCLDGLKARRHAGLSRNLWFDLAACSFQCACDAFHMCGEQSAMAFRALAPGSPR